MAVDIPHVPRAARVAKATDVEAGLQCICVTFLAWPRRWKLMWGCTGHSSRSSRDASGVGDGSCSDARACRSSSWRGLGRCSPVLVLVAALLLFSAAAMVSWRISPSVRWTNQLLVTGQNTTCSHPLSGEPPAWLEDAKSRSDALERHVRDTCKALRLPEDRVSLAMEHMLYDDARKVIYCFIPKVASTSWKRVWLRMRGINDTAMDRYIIHTFLPSLAFDKNKEEKLRTYKKFLVVRHPLERVLSAFRDKLETPDEHPTSVFRKQIDYFSKKIANMIKTKYRGTTHEEGHNVTFSEFIRFISEAGHGTPEQRNEHWLSMHELCQPCSVRYDFISRYENLKEDADYLLKWLGLTDLTDGFPASDRTFHASHFDPKYLDQLTHSDSMAFYAKYLLDFLLFDYQFT